jgi:hypothetical protein
MAIQITGSFTCRYATYTNPQIQLIPHLLYRDKIIMDANVLVAGESGSMVNVTAIPYYPTTAELAYPTTPVNPYADLIYALETVVINSLTGSNPECTFNRF